LRAAGQPGGYCAQLCVHSHRRQHATVIWPSIGRQGELGPTVARLLTRPAERCPQTSTRGRISGVVLICPFGTPGQRAARAKALEIFVAKRCLQPSCNRSSDLSVSASQKLQGDQPSPCHDFTALHVPYETKRNHVSSLTIKSCSGLLVARDRRHRGRRSDRRVRAAAARVSASCVVQDGRKSIAIRCTGRCRGP
jgi:hypothetical protein